MGAEQSTNRPATAAQKTCYYELLGVSSTAANEEIRRAYKRKALELHPDRNINDVASSTAKFAQVQTAYEILSDAHERAWYDSHREAILRGDDLTTAASADSKDPGSYHNVRLTSADHIFSIIGQFHSAIPMTDEPRVGFYGTLRELFDQLASEEVAAAVAAEAQNGSTRGQRDHYPPFGESTSDYAGVVRPFYAAWSAFATCKSFAWRDKWRLSDAPDRRTRRVMEKENKKLRADGVKEFNDAVRSLVGFAKKRDRRYVAGAAAAAAAASEKTMAKKKLQQAAKARKAEKENVEATVKATRCVVSEWVTASEGNKDDGELKGGFSESEGDEIEEKIECVVCDKAFKTAKAFESHERSKKHVKAFQALKRQMELEDGELANIGTVSFHPAEGKATVDEDTEAGHEEINRDRSTASDSGGELGEKEEVAEGDYCPNLAVSSPPPPLSPRDIYTHSPPPETSRVLVEEEVTDSRTTTPPLIDVPDSGSDSVSVMSTNPGSSKNHQQDAQPPSTTPTPKIGKAKLKRQKKAAKQEAGKELTNELHKCAVCNNTFLSRTKLFKHINESKHAQLVSVMKEHTKANTKTKK